MFFSKCRVVANDVHRLNTGQVLLKRPSRVQIFFSGLRLLLQSAILLILLSVPTTQLQAIPSFADEYQLKAVFLYNFANFINWPEHVFANAETPFMICILGDDPFGEYLDIMIEEQQAKGRDLTISRLTDTQLSKINDCHILFISKLTNNSLMEIYHSTCRYPILTVSEDDNFMNSGGMIRFFNLNKRVRLEINPEAIEQTGLKADANLLNLSKITRASLAICPE